MERRKLIYNFAEAFRLAVESCFLKLEEQRILDQAPEGDGHPVIFLPGFFGGDHTTRLLRCCVQKRGYKTYGWECGINLGLRERVLRDFPVLVERVRQETGKNPTLVGHSLGGVIAREFSREFPDKVRQVITVGTPFGAAMNFQTIPKTLKAIFTMVAPMNADLLQDQEMALRGLTPPPVPTTSIFSKTDGIVEWTASLNPRAPRAENIEVNASHIGLIAHSQTLKIVLDRLGQSEDRWRPYRRGYTQDLPQNPRWRPRSYATRKILFAQKCV